MRKVIAIGEAGYDIVFADGRPQAAYPGGRILNATASLARAGVPAAFVSECGSDYFGDLIVKHLDDCGVATRSIDRYTEGTTLTSVIHPEGRVLYGSYPPDRFNVVWQRIDEGDILVFGSFIAVDAAARERLFEIVRYARERKAITVYLPGFYRGENFRITRVMTAILENLEMSDFVITNALDLRNVFGTMSSAEAYREKVEFYCRNYVHITPECGAEVWQGRAMTAYACPEGGEPQGILGWRAGFLAGLVAGIIAEGVTCDNARAITPEQWKGITDAAFLFAAAATRRGDNVITPSFGAKMNEYITARTTQDQ